MIQLFIFLLVTRSHIIKIWQNLIYHYLFYSYRCFLVAELSPMSVPSSLNVLINPQALNQATVASASCGNVIYMIRGAKSENGNQIVIQNTQELFNLLNKNHTRISINPTSYSESNIASSFNDVELKTENNNQLINTAQQHVSKDGRIIIKTLDKSHSFLVVRNNNGVGSGNSKATSTPISLIEAKIESKDELKTLPTTLKTTTTSKYVSSKSNENVKDSSENSEIHSKHVPIGSGEYTILRFKISRENDFSVFTLLFFYLSLRVQVDSSLESSFCTLYSSSLFHLKTQPRNLK
jgi:hypothetical protein